MPNNIAFIGNLTHKVKDQLQMETRSGLPRLTFRILVKSHAPGKDIERISIYASAFGSLAENLAETAKKGDRLIVLARVSTQQREMAINGKKFNVIIPSLKATSVGPDLTWASAEIKSNQRSISSSVAGWETASTESA